MKECFRLWRKALPRNLKGLLVTDMRDGWKWRESWSQGRSTEFENYGCKRVVKEDPDSAVWIMIDVLSDVLRELYLYWKNVNRKPQLWFCWVITVLLKFVAVLSDVLRRSFVFEVQGLPDYLNDPEKGVKVRRDCEIPWAIQRTS
jgi:hypothetical protein